MNPAPCTDRTTAGGLGPRLANPQALLEDGLIENSRRLGEVLHQRLGAIREQFPAHVRYVTGKGLLAAVHFLDPGGRPLADLSTEVCWQAMRRDLLLVHTGRESIKLAPPPCITREAREEGLDVLAESIQAALARKAHA